MVEKALSTSQDGKTTIIRFVRSLPGGENMDYLIMAYK